MHLMSGMTTQPPGTAAMNPGVGMGVNPMASGNPNFNPMMGNNNMGGL